MDISEVLASLSGPIFQHLGRSCSAREIVLLKCVSKSWAQLVSDNSMIIALSRWEDGTKDWYFPLRFELDSSREVEGEYWNSYIWSGVHHASGEIHRLPPLPPFDSDCILRAPPVPLGAQYYDHRLGCLIASAGGLLLFANKMVTWISPSSLVVLNPLTQQWRSLPAAGDLAVILRENRSIEAHMMVDEKANSYKVILTFLHHVCVYTSTSNSWQYRSCPEIIPFRTQPPFGATPQKLINQTDFRDAPCVLAAGKLYYVQLDVEGYDRIELMQTHEPSDTVIRSRGCIEMVKVDYEAGTQKPPVRLALRNYFLPEPDEYNGLGVCSFQVNIVGCVNGLYAILPALNEFERAVDVDIMRANSVPDLDRGQTYRAYHSLPLQFHILRLSGTGLAIGYLRIQIPSTMSEEEKILRLKCDEVAPWYSCIGRGRVIRLLWDDYLVDSDVVTGISTTKILPDESFGPQYEHQPALDYRASFHMKPISTQAFFNYSIYA